MAFVTENFAYSGMGAGNSAPKIFSYNGSADTKAAVIADNYFNPIYKQLAVGDMIFSSSTTVNVGLYVASITAGAVVTGYIAVA